jgi:hypothetical protein
MENLNSNFRKDNKRFEQMKTTDLFGFVTFFVGYYKNYSMIVDKQISLNEENNEKIELKTISLTLLEEDKFKDYVELDSSEINEIINEFGILNYRIYKQESYGVIKGIKLLYIQEILNGIEYSEENEIFRSDIKLN